MRKYRKREHIENFLRTAYKGHTLLEDVFLYHNSLPEMDFEEISTSTNFLDKKNCFPLMINAVTGGSDFSKEINLNLAQIAKHFNIPMAVGSETIIFEDKDILDSFKIVRETLGDGIVIGNLSGRVTPDEAKEAVELINADALQIHLNPAQEIVMGEGERSFTNILSNIEEVVKHLEVPVIVKEVGFGISRDVAKKLYNIGVRYIDVSGYGGSNFIEIENLRTPNRDLSELFGWGIPTALSLIENVELDLEGLNLIASGGIRTAQDVVKSLVLGANMVAISGEIISYVVHGGVEYTIEYIDELIYRTKMIMLLTGSKNIEDLKNVEYKITGRLKELLTAWCSK